MSKRRNGEGSFGVKNVHGTEYQYYRDVSGKQIYAKTMKELEEKINAWKEQEGEKRLKHNSYGTLTVGEFAKNWLESADTHLYRQLANSVTVNVIAENIKKVLDNQR